MCAGRTCVPITLSHQVSGRLGLLERESAAIINAALQVGTDNTCRLVSLQVRGLQ